MILPKVRDLRMVTFRRGGTLTDDDHQLLALWAAECADHVLAYFERERPDDPRPRDAIAARPLAGAARFAAYSAGQAACVRHVAEHDLGAAAYAIKAAQPDDPEAGRVERDWQRAQLPEPVRQLVLEGQVRRNEICWSAFSD